MISLRELLARASPVTQSGEEFEPRKTRKTWRGLRPQPIVRRGWGRAILLVLMGATAVETRGATVLESSTRPCLHGAITRSKSTALPKTVKPWHPSSRLFVPKAFPPQQRKHPILSSLHHAILALPMQFLRATQRNQTLVVRNTRKNTADGETRWFLIYGHNF